MWISQKCWEKLNPVIKFEDLSLNDLPNDKKWLPESYVS